MQISIAENWKQIKKAQKGTNRSIFKIYECKGWKSVDRLDPIAKKLLRKAG